jgi:predicted dithiol-disulfide oxidoreductase (DUF899 family)
VTGVRGGRRAIHLAGRKRPFKARMGWTFPWYSSRRSDFSYDFHASFDESRAPIEYNYRGKAKLEAAGVPVGEWDQPFDLDAISVFLRDGGAAFMRP